MKITLVDFLKTVINQIFKNLLSFYQHFKNTCDTMNWLWSFCSALRENYCRKVAVHLDIVSLKKSDISSKFWESLSNVADARCLTTGY